MVENRNERVLYRCIHLHNTASCNFEGNRLGGQLINTEKLCGRGAQAVKSTVLL